MKQGSQEWHDFRKKHIGASEVAAVLGESDFMSQHELWELKTGRKEPFKGNWATQRGSDAEPKIRALYEELYLNSTRLTQPVVEFKGWPILSASLDGWNEETNIVVEIKYPSAEKHALAKMGFVPRTYEAQLQTQMLCIGAEVAHYVSFDGQGIEVVVVNADPERQAQILSECKKFWDFVERDISPLAISDETLESLAEKYKELDINIKLAEKALSETKTKICEIVKEEKALFYGLSFTRSKRKGSIDYAKVPELKGVNLEAYRKEGSEVVTIKHVENDFPSLLD